MQILLLLQVNNYYSDYHSDCSNAVSARADYKRNNEKQNGVVQKKCILQIFSSQNPSHFSHGPIYAKSKCLENNDCKSAPL